MNATAAIEQRLIEFAGLDAELVGHKAIAAAVKRHMETTRCSSAAEYLAKIDNDTAAWDHLLEEVLIRETWFFRDNAPFEYLRSTAHILLANKAGKRLRILSVPCSTGEEPYSVAITLFEAGLLKNQFEIDGVDISGQALQKAKTATYRAASFRGRAQQFRERYFDPVDGSYKLRADIAACVHFRRGNLADSKTFQHAEKYDVILCRNVLIYFTPAVRERVIAMLDKMLADNGILIVGHADDLRRLTDRFEPVPQQRAYSFRKVKHAARSGLTRAQIASPIAAKRRATRMLPRPAAPAKHATIVVQDSDFKRALQLADDGKLKEARALLEKYLAAHPGDADGWYSLGMVLESQESADKAESCFTKALYLNASHSEAILQLSMLAERRGDHESARRLKGRSRRLQQMGDAS
jgi:chemotaxis protein methyltransferase WspC